MWLDKFLNGGLFEEELEQVWQAIQENPQAVIQQLMKTQKGKMILQQLMQMHPEIQNMLQAGYRQEGGVLEYLHSLKCGGKMKKKKATKKEQGGWIVSKKACGCKLKRVGGKLIQINTCAE